MYIYWDHRTSGKIIWDNFNVPRTKSAVWE